MYRITCIDFPDWIVPLPGLNSTGTLVLLARQLMIPWLLLEGQSVSVQ